MKSAPIGIFDSGLGGLTVASEIARALPHESIVYLGDTARCPYGPQSLDDVRRYVFEICSFLENQGVKLIVIACNTATAAGLTLAQQHFSVPIVGVVEPGARAAVQATRNRLVGVIGTQGTIQSGIYSEAVRTIDAGCTVFSVATPLFVEIVEEGLMFDESHHQPGNGYHDVYIRSEFYEIARDYLNPLQRNHVDTLVLGCTHYPLLATAISQVMGPEVILVSSAAETSHEVATTLARRHHEALPTQIPSHAFYTTGSADEFARLGSRVFGAPLSNVEHVPVNVLESSYKSEAK